MPLPFIRHNVLKEEDAVNEIREHATSLKTAADLDPLLDRIGDARVVMLGEASHGTHEYYNWRTVISKRLIEEKGFNFIAVEGDWPDCYRLNRYIKNYTKDKSGNQVLHQFNRWPTWMWANWEVAALTEWMHQHNINLSKRNKIGFYGLDVYSLWESMTEIINYLEKVDRNALEIAKKAFRCFEPYRDEDGFGYASALRMVPELCETEVANLLATIQNNMPVYDHDYESAFNAEQNALVALNAEKYYRAMLQGSHSSWNARDSHMHETLQRLLNFYGGHSKAIIWAHNTHIGDASATTMADAEMFNLGQLAREKYGRSNVVLVGMGSYEGTVIAAGSWGAEMRVIEVPQGREDSWECLLHKATPENSLLIMDSLPGNNFAKKRIGHRAIGVVYNPLSERGNYVPSLLNKRYDAFLYFDKTKALHPMHINPSGHKMPETYPFGV